MKIEKAGFKTLVQRPLLVLGVLALVISIFANNISPMAAYYRMSIVALVMATWWVFEVLPLAATALLPIVAYPFLDIMPAKDIAPAYMSSVLMLFIGGFLVALAMQEWNLHRRLALTVLSWFGGRPSRMLFGFMLCTFTLSMWMSNTAATVMMVSIGLALISHFEDLASRQSSKPEQKEEAHNISVALMLGIAYSATIGGMATLVGTPPNLTFARTYAFNFPDKGSIGFTQWFIFGLPVALVIFFIAFFWLKRFFLKAETTMELPKDVIRAELKALGPLRFEEITIMAVFFTMAFAWIFRADLTLGALTIPGWSRLLAHGSKIDDGTVAIMMALCLFIIPARQKKGRGILHHEVIGRIPWHTILLFGGGFALAKGMQASGLSAYIGEKFLGAQGLPQVVFVPILTLGMSFLTEVTSNMASTEMMLPVIVSVCKSLGISAVIPMIGTTLAASAAFMLPAATAPNAIVFGSGIVSIKDMARVGIIINFCAVLVIVLAVFFIVPLSIKL